MGNGDLALAALELIPGVDLAEEDVDGLLLGQLKVLAVGLVVGDGDSAAYSGELNHPTLYLGSFTCLDWFVRSTEFNGAYYVLTHARAGTNRLIIDAHLIGHTSERALIESSREGCTGTTDGGLSKRGNDG